MVLHIQLPPQTEARLRRQAETLGADLESYVAQLVERAAARESLDVLLAPLRQRFAQSGISDEELIADITAAQVDYRSKQDSKMP